ncbi:Gfo/Idh/MocA family oxidoreductase [Amnibacterium sp. CER49]|uniref:Gfo/Idh/MocA family protein n=1 Tax=Amnibacterium sp. CER49 TaxID=3039161 RepID=UPI00244C60C0|nr:Gfo/Idh/MocA family oxidoreductase [Amnibacterium sp. CER49]MDH2443317.1 Gfo/Idh/MocA family oxidoreductase [Amnibacterium sp. CER49]
MTGTRGEISWAVLGTGKIARIFAEALRSSATGRLAAVGSRSASSAARFAEAHGADRWHEGYEAALADAQIDAVYIATPHTTHFDLIVAAAQQGKHILCEKPLTVTAGQATDAVAAARRAGVALMEGFAFRYHSQTRRMLALIRDGSIGEVRAVDASFGYDAGPAPDNYLLRRELAGGSILDVGCYTVAMARLVAGAAEGRPFADPSRVLGAGLVSDHAGVDLGARATLEFESGVVASIECSIISDLPNTVTVWGSRGVLTMDQPWLPGPTRPGTIGLRNREGHEEIWATTGEDLYAAEADELARCAAHGESAFMTGADTVGNMRVLDEWRHSIGLRFAAD